MANLGLFVVLTFLGVANSGLEMCQDGYKNNGTTITFAKTCSKNCSQEPPRIDGDTQFFNCSIGGKSEVTDYRKNNPKYFEVSSEKFSAPKIKDVELYYKCFSADCFKNEMALKLNFFLPPGISGKGVSDSVMPQAVLLRFESIADKSVQDTYYYNCPRERIFRFHNYSLVNSYDLYNLRELSYDCLVGLETNKHMFVYNITLQTAQGKSASFITTVVPRPNKNGIMPWRPVIMAHLNVTNQSLYVVVEKAPPIYKVWKYIINLVREADMVAMSSNIIDFKNKSYVNFTTFGKVLGGRYLINIIPRCPEACILTVNTSSYRIIIPGNKNEYPHYLEVSLDTMHLVAMVSGCTAGVALVLFLVCCFLRRRKNQERYSGVKPKGYIIHPHRKSSREYELVINLKRFIGDNCDCTAMDYLEMKLNTDLAESREESIVNSLRESSYVVVIYSYNVKGDRTDNDSCSDFYYFVLNKTIEQRKRSNSLRIIEIRFPSNRNVCPTILTKHRKLVKTVNFCTEPAQLYCKIHGIRKPPENNANEALKSNPQWRLIMARFQGNNDCNLNGAIGSQESEVAPLLSDDKPNNIECLSKDDKLKQACLDQNVVKQKDVSCIFKQMESINQESDDEVDGNHFHSARSNTLSATSEPGSLTGNPERIARDIPSNTRTCISIEADVHNSHDSRPSYNDQLTMNTNNQQVAFKNNNKANSNIKKSEYLPRICNDSTNACKMFHDSRVSGQKNVHTLKSNHCVNSGQHLNGVPDKCCHKNRGNEQKDGVSHKQYLTNENNSYLKMYNSPKGDSATPLNILKGFNVSDTDSDDANMYPVEQQRLCNGYSFPHHTDFQGSHLHQHRQQFHPGQYDDDIVYGKHMQADIHPIPANFSRMPHGYGPNINTNEVCMHSRQANRYFADGVQNGGGYIGQPPMHEFYPHRDSVHYQEHLYGFNSRLNIGRQSPRSSRFHHDRHMRHGGTSGFHPPQDCHLPTNTLTCPPGFILSPASEENIRFRAVDPPTDRMHETLVKERSEAQSLTRSSSSKSLPPDMWYESSDLDGDQIVTNDYNKYHPYPPDEEDDQLSLNRSSEILDQFLQINQNSRTK